MLTTLSILLIRPSMKHTPKLLHCLPHVDYNVHGEYVKAFPTDTASDPVPTDTVSDPVPTETASDPVQNDTPVRSVLRKEQRQPLLSLENFPWNAVALPCSTNLLPYVFSRML